ncbi:unnamed protein product [Pelagomonas calceolata]|uniref:Uncharacterized protein n=1 Tax=Pelagomonas calceolata TaxID=35677 RepID=A0A8J2X3Q7_9STRA|nr:unnamed protein product [Pelagomonas calceolata]
MDDASAGGEEDQNWAACDLCGSWRKTNHSVDKAHSFSCASIGRDCSEPCDGCRQHECVCSSDDEALSDGAARGGSEYFVSDDNLRVMSAHGVATDGDGASVASECPSLVSELTELSDDSSSEFGDPDESDSSDSSDEDDEPPDDDRSRCSHRCPRPPPPPPPPPPPNPPDPPRPDDPMPPAPAALPPREKRGVASEVSPEFAADKNTIGVTEDEGVPGGSDQRNFFTGFKAPGPACFSANLADRLKKLVEGATPAPMTVGGGTVASLTALGHAAFEKNFGHPSRRAANARRTVELIKRDGGNGFSFRRACEYVPQAAKHLQGLGTHRDVRKWARDYYQMRAVVATAAGTIVFTVVEFDERGKPMRNSRVYGFFSLTVAAAVVYVLDPMLAGQEPFDFVTKTDGRKVALGVTHTVLGGLGERCVSIITWTIAKNAALAAAEIWAAEKAALVGRWAAIAAMTAAVPPGVPVPEQGPIVVAPTLEQSAERRRQAAKDLRHQRRVAKLTDAWREANVVRLADADPSTRDADLRAHLDAERKRARARRRVRRAADLTDAWREANADRLAGMDSATRDAELRDALAAADAVRKALKRNSNRENSRRRMAKLTDAWRKANADRLPGMSEATRKAELRAFLKDAQQAAREANLTAAFLLANLDRFAEADDATIEKELRAHLDAAAEERRLHHNAYQNAWRAADPEGTRAQNRKDQKAYRERQGKDAMNARQRKRRKTDAGKLKEAANTWYNTYSRRFGKDLANWDEPHLRTYKERLDAAYPGGPGEGFASTDSRYAGLRARYEKLELLLVELDRRRLCRRR